jgi:xylulokinase
MPLANAGRSNDPLIVGLDMGSTSVKAVIYEPTGKTVAYACLPAAIHYPRPTWAFYEPSELWDQAVQVLREATSQVDDSRRIAGIAVASVGEAGVPLDAHGEPTHEFIAWFDRRTLKQHAWLEETLGWDRLYEITGQAMAPIYGVFKQLWIKEHKPDAWSRAVRWLNVADYIAFKLSGGQATDWSLACRSSAFDIRRLDWSDEILDVAGISREIQAPPVPSGTAVGTITADAARLTGLPETAVVAAGGHDHICGALAAGITHPGRVLDSFGTAEVVLLSLDQPLPGIEIGRQGYCQGPHVATGLYYTYGGLWTSGASINWWKDVLGADHETLIAEASAAPAGSMGVAFLPHLRMGDTPHLDPRSQGAFLGLTTDITRGVLTRAVFEGLAYEARAALEPLLSLASIDRLDDVVMIGGGTRNELLTQIKASIFNADVHLLDLEEATALGAAILGGIGAGVYRDAEDALSHIQPTPRVVKSNMADAQIYESYFNEVFQPIYGALRDVNHAIHRFAHGESQTNQPDGA